MSIEEAWTLLKRDMTVLRKTVKNSQVNLNDIDIANIRTKIEDIRGVIANICFGEKRNIDHQKVMNVYNALMPLATLMIVADYENPRIDKNKDEND